MTLCLGVLFLSWGVVSDPSGIERYVVRLERPARGGGWGQPMTFEVTGGTTQPVPLTECPSLRRGQFLRFRCGVDAVDAAGNWSSGEAWAEFLVAGMIP